MLIQVESKTNELNKSKEVAKEIAASYGGLVGGSASQSTIEKYRRYLICQKMDCPLNSDEENGIISHIYQL